MIRALPIFLIAAAIAAGCVTASGAQGSPAKVLVVLGGRAAQSPALIERASRMAAAAGAQLRVPRTATEELGVTHVFAVRHYTAVIAVDLDARVSVAPVAARYPSIRFVTVAPAGDAIARALAQAAR